MRTSAEAKYIWPKELRVSHYNCRVVEIDKYTASNLRVRSHLITDANKARACIRIAKDDAVQDVDDETTWNMEEAISGCVCEDTHGVIEHPVRRILCLVRDNLDSSLKEVLSL